MPDFVFINKKLSLGAKTLYALLCDYAGERDHCWPSHKTLAVSMGCSVSSVKTYLGQLVRHGLIAGGDVGETRVRSCMYFLRRPSSSSASSQNLPTPQPESGYDLNLNESKKENTPLPPKAGGSATTVPAPSASGRACARGGAFSLLNKEFEKFWAAYPRKEAKEQARAAWHRLRRSGALPPLDAMLSSLARAVLSETWRKESGRYIPMAGNYLRGRRWTDMAAPAPEDSPPAPETSEAVRRHAERDELERRAAREKHAALRPAFEAMAARFAGGVNAAAFGLWTYLHEQGMAPKETDLPARTEGLRMAAWLHTYKMRTLHA